MKFIEDWCDEIFQEHKKEPYFTMVWTKSEMGKENFFRINAAVQKMIDDGILKSGTYHGVRKTTIYHQFVTAKSYSAALDLARNPITKPSKTRNINVQSKGIKIGIANYAIRNKDELITGIIIALFAGLLTWVCN